mgnify:FL=1
MFDPGPASSVEPDGVVPLWRTEANQRHFSSWASGLGAEERQDKSAGLSGLAASSQIDGPAPSTNTDADIFDVAYKKGWEDGQAALSEDQGETARAMDALAAAVDNVNNLSSAGSFGFILAAIESLFRRCAELAVPDPALLQAWTKQLADMVDQDQKGGMLILHPADVALIDSETCKLPLRGDETMLRGNVKLSHSGGWIEKGSEVALDELKALIDEFSGTSVASHDQ